MLTALATNIFVYLDLALARWGVEVTCPIAEAAELVLGPLLGLVACARWWHVTQNEKLFSHTNKKGEEATYENKYGGGVGFGPGLKSQTKCDDAVHRVVRRDSMCKADPRLEITTSAKNE